MAQHDGPMSDDSIRAAASESVAGGPDIREAVRQLTLKALRQRDFDFDQFHSTLKAMTEGISLGAEKRGQDVKTAMAQAFAGMDQALTKAAQAGSLALKELSAKGKDFSDTDLQQGLAQMKRMEADFLDTLKQVAGTTKGNVRTAWDDLIAHAQRTGTDTGTVVSETAREFSQRMASTVSEGATVGLEAARQFGERFAAAASGFFAGMSEALRTEKDKASKQ